MPDHDATVRLARPGTAPVQPPSRPPAPAGRGRPVALIAAAGALVAVTGSGAALWFLRGADPADPPPKPEAAALAPPPPIVPAAALYVEPPAIAATEDTIREHRAAVPTLFSLANNPRVFVIDFPDLEAQGAAMNRVAALIEKAGAPRDRVLDDAELAAAIARSGETPATYYYGHNYRGRDIDRFFALAAQQGIALTAGETWLRDQLARIRTTVPAGDAIAILSVPGLDARIDPLMRRAILHHEIGHGHFFTNTAFADHVGRVWREVFTADERAHFRAFLQREGYDPSLEEVMMNEAMAYLIFTPDTRFFTPAHAGLDEARADELRAALRDGVPR
ncbi:hypothetical protein GXW78_11550 [Roseomonas terrae]|uniref:Uncharacterized protein n=1 Tax=Neoroseomonas terrae TaxID=424799 RepID=A0ABS5EGZ7_9PROT|nr:hypothetical protein [Neoroseomonas terrae]MBR0650299.1 hypothetical protein [Neoroseomonas terrae]